MSVGSDTLVVLVSTLVALAREPFPPPATVLGAVVLLLVFGVVAGDLFRLSVRMMLAEIPVCIGGSGNSCPD